MNVKHWIHVAYSNYFHRHNGKLNVRKHRISHARVRTLARIFAVSAVCLISLVLVFGTDRRSDQSAVRSNSNSKFNIAPHLQGMQRRAQYMQIEFRLIEQ